MSPRHRARSGVRIPSAPPADKDRQVACCGVRRGSAARLYRSTGAASAARSGPGGGQARKAGFGGSPGPSSPEPISATSRSRLSVSASDPACSASTSTRAERTEVSRSAEDSRSSLTSSAVRIRLQAASTLLHWSRSSRGRSVAVRTAGAQTPAPGERRDGRRGSPAHGPRGRDRRAPDDGACRLLSQTRCNAVMT